MMPNGDPLDGFFLILSKKPYCGTHWEVFHAHLNGSLEYPQHNNV